MENPFLLKGYKSRNLFCDREDELLKLFSNIENGVDTTLISSRRMGKTGLILHLFEQLKKNKEIECLYVDINFALSQSDFNKLLAETILKKFPEKTPIGKKFINILKGFRPVISFDGITGEPQIQIDYISDNEKTNTLQGLLHFLNSQKSLIVFAIDEFQQINEFPEQNTETILRSIIQHLHNIRFIFCGSKQTMMTDMFSNAKRPFFASTQFLFLDKISENSYSQFIKKLFAKYGKQIDCEIIQFILTWTKRHTFYTQSLCNMVFNLSEKIVTMNDVKKSCIEIMKRNENIYLQYKQLLTVAQWKYLIAVAKEQELEQHTSKKFISKYNIGTPTDSRRLIKTLLEKDLILETITKDRTFYRVYDVFFSHWLESEY